MSGENKEEPENKKTKVEIPDGDVDDLVGDLIKEELQLLITRVIKDNTEFVDPIKDQIVKIIKSRSRQTPAPKVTQEQMSQLIQNPSAQQLFQATQSLGTQMGMSSQDLFGGFSQPMLPFMGGGMRPQGGGGGGMMMPGMDLDKYGVDVGSIRRRVKEAFQTNSKKSKKRGGFGQDSGNDRYHVVNYIIQEEIKTGKNAIMISNDVRKGLSIFEAVTSEYVNRGAELGENTIDGYQDMLEEIANEWIEIMLDSNLDEIGDERKQWVEKLYEWDTSASEEEGTFSIARAAAKLGWKDTQLQQVLKGEGIGKYKEPQALSVARLNQLEREKRYEEGVNLAKSVDLDFYTAKFLLKLDKKEEAEQIAVRYVLDPSKLFSIAQVAKSVDVEIAFGLAIRSIGMLKDNLPQTWSNDIYERTMWVIDLSISQHLEETLIKKTKELIKNKSFQFEMCKMLKQKEQFQTALEIAKYCLTPYSVQDESKIEKIQKVQIQQQQQQKLEGTPTGQTSSTSLQDTVALQDVDPGSIIPSQLCVWLWELSHEMLLLDLCSENEMKIVLKFILDTEKDSNQLVQLIRRMKEKLEWELIIQVGFQIFEIVKQQREKESTEQKAFIKMIIEDPSILETNPLAQLISINYNSTWDNSIYNSCQQMINAISESRKEKAPILNVVETTTNNKPKLREIEPISEVIAKKVLEKCLENLTVIDHQINFGNLLFSVKEYSMVLESSEKFLKHIVSLEKEKKKIDEWVQDLADLRQEEQELISKNKKLKQNLVDKMKKLQYEEQVLKLSHRSVNYNAQRYDQLKLQIIQNTVTSGLNGVDEEKIQFDEFETVLDTLLQYLRNPNHFIQLGNTFNMRREFRLTNKVGQKCQQIVEVLREKYTERKKLEVPYNLLIQEQEYYLSNLKTVPSKLQEEIKEQLKKIDQLDEVEYFDSSSNIDYYDNTHYSIAQQMIQGSINSKIKQVVQQTTNVFGNYVAPTQKVIEKKPLENNEIQTIIDICLKFVKKPVHLISLLNIISTPSYEEYDFSIYLTKKIQQRIIEVSPEKAKLDLEYFEFQELSREEEKLKSIKKSLSPEDEKKLKQMKIENGLKCLIPSYFRDSSNEYDKQQFTITQTLLNLFFTKKVQFQNQLEELIESELQNGDKMIEEDDEEEEIPETKESLEEKIKKTRIEISDVLEFCLPFNEDPNNLLKISNLLKSNSEFDKAIHVGKQTKERVDKCIKERDARDILLDELKEIEDEENELELQRKQLKTKKTLDASKLKRMKELVRHRILFNSLPSYTKSSNTKFDQLLFKVAEMMIYSYFSKSEEDVQKDEISNLIDYCLSFILNPNHIFSIIQILVTNQQIDLMISVMKKDFTRISECVIQKLKRDKLQIRSNILTEEQNQLTLLRKQLTDDLKQELDSIILEDLPDYILHSDYAKFDELKYNIGYSILHSLLNLKEHLLQEEQEEHEDDYVKKFEVSDIESQIEKVLQFLLEETNGIQNPDSLLKLVKSVKSHDISIKIGETIFKRVQLFRKESEKNFIPSQKYAELKNESLMLLKSRKELTEDKQKELRSLEFDVKLLELRPYYEKYTSNEYDSIVFKASNEIIQSCLADKTDLENRMQMDSQVTEDQMLSAINENKKHIDDILSMCLDNILLISNLVHLVNSLSNKLEYGMAILVGKKCQQRIDDLNKLIDHIESLQEEKQNLIQQNKIKPSKDKQNKIEKIDQELTNVKVETYDKTKIRNDSLRIAKLMMNALKVENADSSVLREQAINIFKIEMSLESLGEVKILTEPDDWEKQKNELMNYVINMNKAKDPNAKLTSGQIELLLSEDMINECINGFPDPNDETSPELLERLWIEIEKKDSKSLKKLLPLVNAYVTHDYLQYIFDGTASLLDIVEAYDSDWVIDLYIAISDTLLVSIVQKQYKDFVEFLEVVKNRIPGSWDEFIEGVKKKHKGKKKLMQMITMAGY
eukprot:gene3429-5974_t